MEDVPPSIEKPVVVRRVCGKKCVCSSSLKDKLIFEAAELVTGGQIYSRILETRPRSQTRTRCVDPKDVRHGSKHYVGYGGTYNWKEMLSEACKPKCGQTHRWDEKKFSDDRTSLRGKCGKRELWTLWMLYLHMMRMERANDEGVFIDYYFQDVF